MIKILSNSILVILIVLTNVSQAIQPESVAILYNSNSADSEKLAKYYAIARNIPAQNLIGLPTSEKGKISRTEYISTIQDPLRKHFTAKGWWTLQTQKNGQKLATKNDIKLLVTMRGIPFGINQDTTIKAPLSSNKTVQLLSKSNNASVDSELAALSIHDFALNEPLQNHYFKADVNFSDSNKPFYMLTGRIDDAKLETCIRMIDDAIEVEKTGLYGMCYLDQAKKGSTFQLGDNWITNIEKRSWDAGIPVTMDKNKDTYLTNYPMKDTALYFGWYTTHKNGPFLNPHFKLKKGAIAVHLHSFSATSLRSSNHHWTGPIINAGAAATVGNVYEPYLGGTHHLDILHDRLLKGYTLVESAFMAIPILSWQNVVIGDPLYRPYKKDAQIPSSKNDKFYLAVKVGLKSWKDDEDKISLKFRTAAQKTKEARYYEITGLYKRYKKKLQEATLFFNSADKLYLADADKTRMQLHKIDILREQGKKDDAILTARMLKEEIKGTPEHSTVTSILNILSPPPPPAAKPNKQTPPKK